MKWLVNLLRGGARPSGRRPEASRDRKRRVIAGAQLREIRLMVKEGTLSAEQAQKLLGVDLPVEPKKQGELL
jgi:hypothetical protein